MNSEIRIEPTKESRIEGPDGTVMTVWGLVYEDDEARAVYYARWNDTQLEQAEFVVSLGDWGEGSEPSARDCVAALGREHAEKFSLMLIDALNSSFAQNAFLGVMRSAAEVRGQPLAKKFFHVLDHVILEDERVGLLCARLESRV